MQLNSQELLIQEALIGRIQQRAQQWQNQMPEEVVNPLAAATAIMARLLHTTDADLHAEVNIFTDAIALGVMRDRSLAELSKQMQDKATGPAPEVEVEDLGHADA